MNAFADCRKGEINLRLVATEATAEKMAFMKSRLPKPTLVLSNLTDSFKFENLTTEVHRFAHPAHTDDHSVWLLKEEKVLHSPDLLNPDQLPMMDFAVSDTIVYRESNIKEAVALDWDYCVAGHGNIGSKKDSEFELTFLNDLRRAIDAKGLDELAQEILGLEIKVCDVSKREDIEQMVAAGVDALGGLGVLVNNAGIAGPTAPVEEFNQP